MHYTVMFLFLKKDFPEDDIYSRGRNLHCTWPYVPTRQHRALKVGLYWTFLEKSLKGNHLVWTHLLRFSSNFQWWRLEQSLRIRYFVKRERGNLLPWRYFQINLKRSKILIGNCLYCHHATRKRSAFPHWTDVFPLVFSFLSLPHILSPQCSW